MSKVKQTKISTEEKLLNNHLRQYVKIANQRLRQLERSNIGASSPAYQYILNRADKSYMGRTANGEIKFRTDIASLTKQEKEYLNKRVEDFLNARTSTVSGYKGSYNEAYESFINNPDMKDLLPDNFTIEQWGEMMKHLKDRMKEHNLSSDEVIEISTSENYLSMSDDERNDFWSKTRNGIDEYLSDIRDIPDIPDDEFESNTENPFV